ncbi:MAG TPA: TolC family protein [Bacteroidota bacterium]|nr:TolC family protein [Bacteroidota bacterium]
MRTITSLWRHQRIWLLLMLASRLLLRSDAPAMDEDRTADTVRLSLPEAENRFLRTNLQLLAGRFSIEAARAQVIQAELWNNPNLSIEQNIYNPATRRALDFTPTGNTGVQLQQLIVLAGKRSKQAAIAAVNSDIAENSFRDLLRALRLELRTDFYDLYFLQQSLRFYDASIPALKKTIGATENIYQSRGILLSEVLRLKSLLFSLEGERLDINNQIDGIQTDLNILMHDTTNRDPYLIPEVPAGGLDTLDLRQISLDALVDSAMHHRPDYRTAQATIEADEQNLALQQAMRSPDVTIGGLWSRQGSYIPDYFALTVAVDLPIFNRNQGNIEAAEATLAADRLAAESARMKVRRDVKTAYDRARGADDLYRQADRTFPERYAALVQGTIDSYQKRNIGIIEFTDFYESYRTSMMGYFKLLGSRFDAIENLNYAVGTIVINSR